MIFLYSLKRLYECLVVHKYSKPTKSFNRLLWEMSYFWLFMGIGISYFLFHPNYEKPFWANMSGSIMSYAPHILLTGFVFGNFMNFLCHWHLRTLREKDGEMTIKSPNQHGFQYISGANYFWDFCSLAILALTI